MFCRERNSISEEGGKEGGANQMLIQHIFFTEIIILKNWHFPKRAPRKWGGVDFIVASRERERERESSRTKFMQVKVGTLPATPAFGRLRRNNFEKMAFSQKSAQEHGGSIS